MSETVQRNSDIGALVREMESDFTTGTTSMSRYVDMSLNDDINKIEAYLESKHTSGETDSQGREKPFFNIVLAARNIWFRATDIDRSNIRIRPTKLGDDTAAFLATVKLQDWMRRNRFGTFLNDWGINSAAYNESVVKFVEHEGKLIPSVVPWTRIICDQVDFNANPKIQILELTEAQLRKKKEYDQELVDQLCVARTKRETVDGVSKDNKDDYIRLYEIHGELPKSYLTGDDDDANEFVQQMHVISFVASKEDGKFDDYILFKGKEKQDPYMLTALLPEIDGSVTLKGAVKVQFDAQWMQNHTTKAIKDQLDLASKLIFQTSDSTFVGQNALSAIQNGDILIHKVNEPITQVNNSSHDTTSLQNYGTMWKQLGNEISGISEQMLGVSAKSGTAWRLQEALLQENHSLFQLMTENKGLAIEDMLRTYIIPHLKKQLDTTDEVVATLSTHDINVVDKKFIKNFSNKRTNEELKRRLLSGEDVSPEEQVDLTRQNVELAETILQDQGTTRTFKPSEVPDKTWKEAFKDLEWEVEVDVTNENLDANALTTLNTMMQILAGNPQALDDPRIQLVWNKILQLTGAVSPVEMAAVPKPQPPTPEVPTQTANTPPTGEVPVVGATPNA